MKTLLKNLLIVVVSGTLLYGVWFYSQNLRGVGPVINDSEQDITEVLKPGVNSTDIPLKMPEGFNIEIHSKNLSGARVLKFDASGNLWVSRTSQGKVTQLRIENGKVSSVSDVVSNLRNPHGLAFDPKDSNILYIAEEHQITKRTLPQGNPVKIADLPTQGGGHYTRTIGFGPDGRLYVSIGSSCNVCREADERRAAIYSLNSDGSDFKPYASGLRNTVFFTWSEDKKMWGTDMGRDLLGDNTPPEEINIIEPGKDYGWPICYGNNINDRSFDKNQYIRDPCSDKAAPKVEMQAHSAPLGLAFVPKQGWPEGMANDLILAFHGSWNRTQPTGYMLVRVKLDESGNYEGIEDFISGWLQGNSTLGRPVDVLFDKNGSMFVSDDRAGVIYKITYNGDS